MSWPGYILLGLVVLAWGLRLWGRIRYGPACVRAAESVLSHEHPGCRLIDTRRSRRRHSDFVGLHALDPDGRAIVRFYEVDKESLRVHAITDPGELPPGWPPEGWR